jgi:hypothetical protein
MKEMHVSSRKIPLSVISGSITGHKDTNHWLQNVEQFQKGTGEEITRNLLTDSGSVRQDE